MTPFWEDDHLTLYGGDCREVLRELPAESVHMVCTSPPYWGLRDYGTASWDGGDPACEHKVRENPSGSGVSGLEGGQSTNGHAKEGFRSVCPRCGARRIDSQLGLEATPEAFVANMVDVFREVRRVLRKDGTLWLNLGDSYNSNGGHTQIEDDGRANRAERSKMKGANVDGLKPKDLVGIPWRVAFALQADGWYLRSDIIWAKPNPMPESVTDRPTKAHEYLFLLTRSPRYYYDSEAVREPVSPHTLVAYPNGPGGGGGYQGDGANDAHQRAGFAKIAKQPVDTSGRNLRSVWSIATEPYPMVKFKNGVGPDGIPDKVSPDCPVHSPLASPRTPQTAEGDARLDPDLSRSPDSAARLDPAPDRELPASSGPGSQGDRQPMPGSSRPGSSVSPIRESARASRTPAPPTGDDGLAATAQSAPRTSHSQGEPTLPVDAATTDGAAATGRNEHASRTTGESDVPGSSGHSMAHRTPDTDVATLAAAALCSCPEYISTSHFATFPRKLVEPCVKAGTSERGVCPECGAPWVRVVEPTPEYAARLVKQPYRDDFDLVGFREYLRASRAACVYTQARVDELLGTNTAYSWWEGRNYLGEFRQQVPTWELYVRLKAVLGLDDRYDESLVAYRARIDERPNGVGMRSSELETFGLSRGTSNPSISKEQVTTGWRSSCTHEAEPVPAVVLDPFAGSGTTLLVAQSLGRRGVGIDLSPDYLKQALERNRQTPLGLVG